MPAKQEAAVSIDLTAVIVAVIDETPKVLTIRAEPAGAGRDRLPSGPLQLAHPTLESGLRAWVREQAQVELGYVEQLYTFGDQIRDQACQAIASRTTGRRHLSLGYVALTRNTEQVPMTAAWKDWYQYFPWEDWRAGPPGLLRGLRAGLRGWTMAAPAPERAARRERAVMLFGGTADAWAEERVLDRYELLYEAGLVAEAHAGKAGTVAFAGRAMIGDHRRILATAISRLRGKIKYRPVVFELMPQGFTLGQLQRAVEALIGARLHKQNFRRLIEEQGLVEETGRRITGTGGRPAREVRFREDVVRGRPISGQRLPILR